MPTEIVTQALSLGVTGLLFVMWWHERQDRSRSNAAQRSSSHHARAATEMSRELLDVVRGNTEALVGLREELRCGRRLQSLWLGRIQRKIEAINRAARATRTRTAKGKA